MIPGKGRGARFFRSFGYAAQGVVCSSKGRNFRVQLGFALLAILLGITLHISSSEWTVVIACIGAVLMGECFNTAIEAVVDLASPEIHPLAKVAKDCAAGAVLCMAFASALIAAIIFLPKLLDLIY